MKKTATVNVREVVASIIAQTFDYDGPITDSMTTDDVDGWDSLSHVTVLLMVERALDVSFSEKERNDLSNIGELFSIAERKCSARDL